MLFNGQKSACLEISVGRMVKFVMQPLSLQGGVAVILLDYAKLSVLESYILS